MSDLAKIVNSVVCIPHNLEIHRNPSFAGLLMDSGYLQEYGFINTSLIEQALRASPGLILDWVQYSEDKRCSEGWFIRNEERGSWEVGYYDMDNGGYGPVESFSDKFVACAKFVKLEVELTRSQY